MSVQRTTSSEFEPLRYLGRGSFGVVLLVRKKGTKETYALKVMRKRSLVERKAVNVARVEREVAAVACHPYVVRLCYAFQSKTRAYLVTEYCPGGSLDRRRLPLPLAVARRVAAQLTLAVEYLHSVGVIHRDLKPANVLFDTSDDARLADFGLAAYCDDVTSSSSSGRKTFAGSVEYAAPELFLKTTSYYDTAVDWWSLGVVTYEMLAGRTPFSSSAVRTLFHNILHAEPDYSDFAHHQDAVACVAALLTRDPRRRADASYLRDRDPFLSSYVRAFDALVLLNNNNNGAKKGQHNDKDEDNDKDGRSVEGRKKREQPGQKTQAGQRASLRRSASAPAPTTTTTTTTRTPRGEKMNEVPETSWNEDDEPAIVSSDGSSTFSEDAKDGVDCLRSSSASSADPSHSPRQRRPSDTIPVTPPESTSDEGSTPDDDDDLCESARRYLSECDDPAKVDSIDLLPVYRPDAFKGFAYCQDHDHVDDTKPPVLEASSSTSSAASSSAAKVKKGWLRLSFTRGAMKRSRSSAASSNASDL